MPADRSPLPPLVVHPLTLDRWPDLETLFGPRGAVGGCWCMWWRLTRAEFDRQKGEANRAALHAIVAAGDPPGLLGYAEDTPVAWCAIAPRTALPALERARTLRRADDAPVWSINCFFVARPYRRRGATTQMIRAAVDYAASRGATVVEGYPVDSRTSSTPDAFAWTGTVAAFRKAGFVEVARHAPTRPIMRYRIAREAAI